MNRTSFTAGLVLLASSLPCPGASAGCVDYSDYVHLEGRTPTRGSAAAVAVSGNHAYVAEQRTWQGGESCFQVIDVSQPWSPAIIGTLDTQDVATGVALTGAYALITAGVAGLQVIDISDPRAPTLVASAETAGGANDLALSGNYAYVVSGATGRLEVFDITNPSRPAAIGSVATPGEARGVAVSGGLAFIADWYGGLQIIDIAVPEDPHVIGSATTSGPASGVAVSGNYTYVAANSGGLQIFDTTDPQSPHLVGGVETSGSADGVTISGDYAYVADGASGLEVIDVADPGEPRIVGSVMTEGFAQAVAVAWTHAYVASGRSGLSVIDIGNPEGVTVQGRLNLHNSLSSVAIAGDYAFLLNQDDFLVLDLTDLENPQSIASLSLPSYNSSPVVLQADYAYVCWSYGELGGVAVINIREPKAPRIVGHLKTGHPYGLAIQGDRAFITEGTESKSKLLVADIGIPEDPRIVAAMPLPELGVGVAVAGSYAYVADIYVGLQAIDISDPLHPWIVSSLDLPGIDCLAVSGGYAYAGSGYSGLSVVDVRDAHAPHAVANIIADGYNEESGVALAGRLAYFAYGAGIHAIDITDPPNARVFSTTEGVGYIWGMPSSGSPPYNVAASDKYVCYAGDDWTGFSAFPAECLVSPSGVAEEQDAPPSLRIQVNPNPALRQAMIRVERPRGRVVRVAIHDLAGRLVRSLHDGALGIGHHELLWDLADDQHRQVAPGVYLARVSTSAGTMSARLVIAR